MGRDDMHISRVVICIILVSLVVLSPIIASPMNPQSRSNGSQRLIFKLNDSLVNNTISKYKFFALDCYASWCEPCKEMNDTLHQLSSELNGQIAIGMIDVENNSKVAQRYNITNYPTLLLFKNGTLIDRQIGFGSESGLVDRFKTLMPWLNTSLVTKPQPSAKTVTFSTTTSENDISLIDPDGVTSKFGPKEVEPGTYYLQGMASQPQGKRTVTLQTVGGSVQCSATCTFTIKNPTTINQAYGSGQANSQGNVNAMYDQNTNVNIMYDQNGNVIENSQSHQEQEASGNDFFE